ncbi:MAG: hypothetical protein GAK37_00305 [Pseudomonas sp.]|nr:MAG: hypothetical protein GAK37_00305 [Pseudomonas sp.]
MAAQGESPDDYHARLRDAREFTCAVKGPEPKQDEGNQAVIAGFIAGVSALVAVTIAGGPSERGDYAVIVVALGAAAATYFYQKHRTKVWYAALSKRMIDTEPKG